VLAQSHLEKALENSGQFILVERQRLKEVLTEAAFQQSGATLSQNAAALGQQLNAKKLLFGQVQRFKRQYTFSLKVVDVTTDQIDHVEQLSLDSQSPAIASTMAHLAHRLAALSVLWSPTPMAFFPADTFIMGSDKALPDSQPAHRVQLGPFYMDPYEVSTIAYFAFNQTNGNTSPFPDQPNQPVTLISWTQARDYCRAQGKRLPTEAEWEYAAAGNDRRSYPWGYAAPETTRARFAGQGQGSVDIDALPGGATPAGLHHLAGNVAEWVQDWWAPDYYRASPANAPSGPAQGDYKVIRGGSWDQPPAELTPTFRAYHNPDRGAAHIGFRCARSAPSDSLPAVSKP
jgi:formylglycine-generating enzyme required for sulfatase activity